MYFIGSFWSFIKIMQNSAFNKHWQNHIIHSKENEFDRESIDPIHKRVTNDRVLYQPIQFW